MHVDTPAEASRQATELEACGDAADILAVGEPWYTTSDGKFRAGDSVLLIGSGTLAIAGEHVSVGARGTVESYDEDRDSYVIQREHNGSRVRSPARNLVKASLEMPEFILQLHEFDGRVQTHLQKLSMVHGAARATELLTEDES